MSIILSAQIKELEKQLRRYETALDLACENRAEISGDPKLFKAHFLAAADVRMESTARKQ